MNNFKEAYSIKKQLVASNINELGNILREHSNIETIYVNPDNTLYLESNCGVDFIKDNIDYSIAKWVNQNIEVPVGVIYNALPISNNSCIIKI